VKKLPHAEIGGARRLTGFAGAFVRIVSIGLSLYVLLYVSTFLELIGIRLYGSHRALVYGIILLLLFMLYPASSRGPWDRIPWYDLFLAAIGTAACFYAFLRWDQWTITASLPTTFEEALGVILICISLEGARRVLGTAFAVIGLLFIVYPIFGNHFPGIFVTRSYSLSQLIQFFYLSGGGSGIFGSPMEIFTTTVAVFLIFGAFLKITGAAQIFMDAALGLAGRYRAGMAKVSVISSALFATVSGVGVANVLVTGAFTIPAMKKMGYRSTLAAAVEAAASTGGILMPPVMGAAAFLMADILAVSYWEIVVAAFLPGILYYVAMFTMVDFEGGRSGLKAVPRTDIPPLRRTLKRGWYLAASITVLLLMMGYKGYPADQAAFYAVLVLLIPGLFTQRLLGFKTIIKALEEGGGLLAQVGSAGAVVGIIMGGFALTGLGAMLPSAMQAIAGDNLFILLLLAAISAAFLGMGAPPLLVYVIMAATIAPAIIHGGVAPLAAHLFIFYFGMLSMLTPPVALSVLVAARVANANFWQASLEAVRLGIIAYIIPFFFVYQPALLLNGAWNELLGAVLTSLAGVMALSAALSRYFFVNKIYTWEIFLLAGAGLLLMYPGSVTDSGGVLLMAPSTIRAVFTIINKRRLARNAAGSFPHSFMGK